MSYTNEMANDLPFLHGLLGSYRNQQILEGLRSIRAAEILLAAEIVPDEVLDEFLRRVAHLKTLCVDTEQKGWLLRSYYAYIETPRAVAAGGRALLLDTKTHIKSLLIGRGDQPLSKTHDPWLGSADSSLDHSVSVRPGIRAEVHHLATLNARGHWAGTTSTLHLPPQPPADPGAFMALYGPGTANERAFHALLSDTPIPLPSLNSSAGTRMESLVHTEHDGGYAGSSSQYAHQASYV